MFYQNYIWFMIAIFACTIFSLIASYKVHASFKRYNKKMCRSGFTGFKAAKELLRLGGMDDIDVGVVGGSLTDHYHPKKKIVNLSEETSKNSSISAVAVAAHEIGHVMQKKEKYAFYQIRTALVPVVNFGTGLALPLVLVGMFLDISLSRVDNDMGFYIAMVGVLLYSGSLIFALVTLPVELDASRRATEMLLSSGILQENEIPAAKKVLSAAALTYLASLLTSLVYFLRFLMIVLTLFGRDD